MARKIAFEGQITAAQSRASRVDATRRTIPASETSIKRREFVDAAHAIEMGKFKLGKSQS